MESIQQQITTLTQKVDRIYQILDRSPQRVSLDLDTQMIGGEETSEHPLNREVNLLISLSVQIIAETRLNGSSTNRIS
jgi:hypothetical protein